MEHARPPKEATLKNELQIPMGVVITPRPDRLVRHHRSTQAPERTRCSSRYGCRHRPLSSRCERICVLHGADAHGVWQDATKV